MRFVPYEHDERARLEAAAHPVGDDDVKKLSVLCAEQLSVFGDDGLRGHPVSFPGQRGAGCQGQRRRFWTGVGSPAATCSTWAGGCGPGTCPRWLCSLELRVGQRDERVRPGAVPEDRHRGRSRARALAAPGSRGRLPGPGAPDPTAGYAQLYGGSGVGRRARPGHPSWSRLRGLGPAFFTKFLYFSVPGALILGNRVANAVNSSSGLPNLVTADHRSGVWTH